jgi:hypothetical protein
VERGESNSSPNNSTAVTKLFNIPDRYGSVCLLEAIQSNRKDVARILLNDDTIDLDVADCDGFSPRSMSVKAALFSEVAAMVNKHAARATKNQKQTTLRKCSNCGKEESRDIKLRQCSRCKQVQYCGISCRDEHWKRKQGGHKNECKKLAQKLELAIQLDKPEDGGMFYTSLSLRGGASRLKPSSPHRKPDGYKKPSAVRVGEKFVIKVQGNGPGQHLMIYDKSRECSFHVTPTSTGFSELYEAVQAEPPWQGRKTFVAASFDEDGNCTVYPGQRSIHKW